MAMTRSGNVLFPPSVSSEIWQEAVKGSAIMQLGRKIPVPASGVEIQTITGKPVAKWTTEAGRKLLSEVGFGKRSFKPHKMSTVVSFSEEFKRDKSALYEEVKPLLAEALSVLFDNTVLRGPAPGDGFDTLSGISDVEFIGTGVDPYDAALEALSAVSAAKGDITGWLVGVAGEIGMMAVKDTTGRPLFIGSPVSDGSVGSLLARPVIKNTEISTEGTIGYAGPWKEIAWGYSAGISYQLTDQPIFDVSGELVHAGAQDNMSSLIVECELGCLIKDKTRFVELTDASYTAPDPVGP